MMGFLLLAGEGAQNTTLLRDLEKGVVRSGCGLLGIRFVF